MGEHTPGPWLAAAKPSSVVGLPVVSTKNGRSVASVTFFALGEQFVNHDAESQANARLIAAAPDMLEALKALKYNQGNEAWKLADAALRKAEGASSEMTEQRRKVP
jgi:hypothetical protein